MIPVFFLQAADAKNLKSKDFSWLQKLGESKVNGFYVCGSSEIQPTKGSIEKNFILGKTKTGLLLSEFISMQKYFSILENENLSQAKSTLEAELKKSSLWQVSENGEIVNKGHPSKIELPFTATIKDCMEGAKTTLGMDCSIRPLELASCCRTKFVGPIVYWGKHFEQKLMYSPDPSVRMKVVGESKHRYCDVQKLVDF